MTERHTTTSSLPVAPVSRWLSPIQYFLHIQSASGIVLLVCTALALILANSPLAANFAAIWKTPLKLSVGPYSGEGTLGHLLIDDLLMTIFFFVVGLEIKRELVIGELRDPKKAMLPVVAALGGMIAPALIYFVLQFGQPGQRGWAIPMATDIAFVVGFLALFGQRVPFGLKIMLLSLAIVDDLGAVLIIAFWFSKSISLIALLVAACGFGLILVLRGVGVRSLGVYLVVGFAIWVAVLVSGIHPTVAGVVLGLLTPTTALITPRVLNEVVTECKTELHGNESEVQRSAIERLEFAAREAVSPLQRLETRLHPWVAFVIMPLFALSNAGVSIEPTALTDPVALAVAAGLSIGKPLGIVLFCYIAIKLKLTSLPDGVNWSMFVGGACLAGIGFTMSLFLTGLAFADDVHRADAGKIGTLLGSLLSAILGTIILLGTLRKRTAS